MIKPIAKAGVALLLGFVAGAGPATQPAATRPGLESFQQDAVDLGSTDFDVRQAATRRMWWAGDPAEAALKAAAMGENPEAVERAQIILQDIEDGITPTTPANAIDLLRQLRLGNVYERPTLIASLRGLGIDGVRILVHLEEHDPSSVVRRRIAAQLETAPRMPVALLLGDGKRAEAEAMLADAMGSNLYAAHDYVAYWEVQPESPARSAALRQPSIDRVAWADAMIEQAAGDHDSAMRDAGSSGQRDLGYWLAAQQGDWAGLLQLLQQRGAQGTLKDVELRALAASLAEDAPSAEAAAKLIPTAQPDPNPGDQTWLRARALCLADHSDDAVKLLTDAGDYTDAWDLLTPQLEYAQQLALLSRAKGNPLQTARLQSRAAATLFLLGKRREASAMLNDAARANAVQNDPDTTLHLIQSARRMERPSMADQLLANGLGQVEAAPLFERAGFSNPIAAASWWPFVLRRTVVGTPIAAVRLLRAMDGGHIPVGDLSELADAFDSWSLSQPPAVQRQEMVEVAWAWKTAGQPDRQIAMLKRCDDLFGDAPSSMALGDAEERHGNWQAAADAYEQASRYDPAFAPAVFLHGYALTQLGDGQRGRSLMDLAHDLPLGNESLRTELYKAAAERGLTADADRESKVLLATGNFNSITIVPLMQSMVGSSLEQKDYAAAARLLAQTLWATAYSNAGFTEPEAYVRIPAQVHRIRAMALFAAHHPAAAMDEAKRFNDCDPNDSTGQMLLIRAAQDAGAQKQADALFTTSIAQFTAQLHDYPDSPHLHNQIAWEEARCRRNLDDALVHAERAAALDPDNPAILDTLAETHYQRKEFQPAIDAMNKAIAADPGDPHWPKRLQRLQLGLRTGTVDTQ